tara:strand:+ start:280 stop:1791 length:1512 start_codon:yes stop_codon:yes gene_type:complete
MKIKIKKKKNLEEMSSMTGGSVHGHAGSSLASKDESEEFNRKQEKDQKLKGKKLTEMYSTRGLSGRNMQQIVSGEKEHAGHVERSKHQGLKNVMENDDEKTVTLDMSPDEEQVPTVIDPLRNAIQSTPLKAIKAVKEAGYEIIGYLGGGQFGKVFKVKNPAMNREEAMKIVMGSPRSISREVRNYSLVQQARSQSDLIAKHFPETYASWEQDNFGFIAMEILRPVANPADAFLVDRYNILSRDLRKQGIIADKEIEAGTEAYKNYRDQSKKAAQWFDTEFSDSLRGSHQFEMMALAGIDDLPDIDFSDLLMEVSPAAMAGLKAQSDMKSPAFQDKVDEHLNLFLNNAQDLPKSAEVLRIVKEETAGAPHVAVGMAMVGNVILNIRAKAMNEKGIPLHFGDLDTVVRSQLEQYIIGYREFSTMRLGYDKKGPQVATGTVKEKWDTIAKTLYDLVGLAPRDVHYGNVMERPNGDLVIVDLGLFKTKDDPAGLFESRKYKLKILRK